MIVIWMSGCWGYSGGPAQPRAAIYWTEGGDISQISPLNERAVGRSYRDHMSTWPSIVLIFVTSLYPIVGTNLKRG